MCGIWLLLTERPVSNIEHYLEQLKARGPEGTHYINLDGKGYIGFTRLAINGLNPAGMQPMEHKGVYSVTNGEIYNWKDLMTKYSLTCSSGSDCEIVGTLYREHFTGRPFEALGDLFSSFDGVFATAIVDQVYDHTIIARDPFGVRPLYIGFNNDTLCLGSEIKSLPTDTRIEPFPPGTYRVYRTSTRELLYKGTYHIRIKEAVAMTEEEATQRVRVALDAAVSKRMMTERPVAALLSGGLDSSLIASLVAQKLKALGLPPLKTFSIGMPGSSDLKYAGLVAQWIGSDHTEVVLGPDDFFKAIPEVIRVTETYDTTTIRASAGNWSIGTAIVKTDAKVVFNGDGSDEVWGSYKYFFNAPSAQEYGDEVYRLLDDIHYFDVLRSDRCISSHGLEPRTPFLDKGFVNAVLSIPLEMRRPIRGERIEKYLLRKAFDDGVTLPPSVLWRKKEAFSDGISGPEQAWYEDIRERAGPQVPLNWKECAVKYETLPPKTPEMFYYRTIYEKIYGTSSVNVPYFWMPKWSNTDDPSARTISD
jgi:asparagine synthase (glutamine-hydrolysing)